MIHPEVLPPQPAIHSDVLDTIYQRRSVRKYKNKAVDRKLINQLIEAARMAPSAINLQPYRFIIADSPAAIKEFSMAIDKIATPLFHLSFLHANPVSDRIFYNAPVVIFIAGKRNNEWAALDIGMCAQNMMLAAKSLGLDTCAIGFAKLLEQTPEYAKLEMHNTEQIFLAVTVGYGDESPLFHGRKSDNACYLHV